MNGVQLGMFDQEAVVSEIRNDQFHAAVRDVPPEG